MTNDRPIFDDKSLRVVISQDGELTFFAAGVDVDYCACGTSFNDAQRRFLRGLALTIRAYEKRGMAIARLATPGPKEYADEWDGGSESDAIEIISLRIVDGQSRIYTDLQKLPFTEIAFRHREAQTP